MPTTNGCLWECNRARAPAGPVGRQVDEVPVPAPRIRDAAGPLAAVSTAGAELQCHHHLAAASRRVAPAEADRASNRPRAALDAKRRGGFGR